MVLFLKFFSLVYYKIVINQTNICNFSLKTCRSCQYLKNFLHGVEFLMITIYLFIKFGDGFSLTLLKGSSYCSRISLSDRSLVTSGWPWIRAAATEVPRGSCLARAARALPRECITRSRHLRAQTAEPGRRPPLLRRAARCWPSGFRCWTTPSRSSKCR